MSNFKCVHVFLLKLFTVFFGLAHSVSFGDTLEVAPIPNAPTSGEFSTSLTVTDPCAEVSQGQYVVLPNQTWYKSDACDDPAVPNSVNGLPWLGNGVCQDEPEVCQDGEIGRPATFRSSHACPRGYFLTAGACRLGNGPADDKNAGPKACVGNPINVATGNKYQKQVDYAQSSLGLMLSRYYNSEDTTPPYLPTNPDRQTFQFGNWRSNFDKYIDAPISPPTSGGNDPIVSVRAVRNDGNAYSFNQVGAQWISDGDVDLRLESVSDGWQLTTTQGTTELYDESGRLVGMRSIDGTQASIVYLNDGFLIDSVEGPFGHSIRFNYNSDNQVEFATLPDGDQIEFAYTNGLLTGVIYPADEYPNQRTLTYLYNEPLFTGFNDLPGALTGIVDESGTRYATYTYQEDGKCTGSQHGLGEDLNNVVRIEYGNSSVFVRDSANALMSTIDYDIPSDDGVLRIIGSIGAGCPSCGSSASLGYNDDGYVNESVDRVNVRTAFTKNDRGLVETVTEASNTPAERDSQFDWHPIYSLPVEMRTESVLSLPGQWRRETMQYNPSGWLLSYGVTGFAPDLENSGGDPLPVSRLATLHYCGDGTQLANSLCPVTTPDGSDYENLTGQLNVIDGPRPDSDANDRVRFAYHPNCTTGGACGQLSQITIEGLVTDLTTQFSEYDAHGRVQKIVDPNGLEMTFVYNSRGWLRSVTRRFADESHMTSFSYYPDGLLRTATTPTNEVLTYFYDTAKYLKEVHDLSGGRMVYDYDDKGNQIEGYYYNGDTLTFQLDMNYDPANYLDYVVAAQNSAEPSVIDFEIDAVGNPKKHWDPNRMVSVNNPVETNIETNYTPDPLRRVTTDDSPVDSAVNRALESYEYDSQNNVTAIVAANGARTEFFYDDLGNLLREVSPDRGTIDYQYDNAGNVVLMTDARGTVSSYEYDALSRLTRISYPDSTLDVVMEYDEYDPGNGQYGRGELTKMTDSGGENHYRYDPFGRMVEHTRVIPDPGGVPTSQTFTITYEYDDDDRLIKVVYPSGRTINYERNDALGRVSAVTTSLPGEAAQTVVSGLQYKPFGPLEQIVYGNGMRLESQIDLQYRLTNQVLYDTADNVIDHRIYQRDRAGLVDAILDGQSNTLSQDFGYDFLFRLDTASGKYLDPAGANTDLFSFNYDKNGNRTEFDRAGNVETITIEPDTNRLDQISGARSVSFDLDAAGNTTSAGVRRYYYNDAGRLQRSAQYDDVNDTEETIATYLYNGLGERVEKHVINGSTTRYLYGADGQLLAEADSGGALLVEYIWLEGVPIAVVGVDSDGDGLLDTEDNCTLFANGPDQTDAGGNIQLDSDQDGFGNGCDADFNNDQIVNVVDLGMLRKHFLEPVTDGSGNAQFDLNGDGVINVQDLGLLRANFFSAPGPAGSGTVGAANGMLFVQYDHLGTPRALWSEAGEEVWSAELLPFGGGVIAPNSSGNVNTDPDGDAIATVFNLRFPGQYFDIETGLHYNYQRTYDPSTGRYLESDPIGLLGGINTYDYARQSPLNMVDPRGESPLAVLGALVGGVTSAISAAKNPCATGLHILGAAASGALMGALTAGLPLAPLKAVRYSLKPNIVLRNPRGIVSLRDAAGSGALSGIGNSVVSTAAASIAGGPSNNSGPYQVAANGVYGAGVGAVAHTVGRAGASNYMRYLKKALPWGLYRVNILEEALKNRSRKAGLVAMGLALAGSIGIEQAAERTFETNQKECSCN
ncbi:MAG: RHS repeat-associated core domain-containing protein [Pseudomonadota bacterium]